MKKNKLFTTILTVSAIAGTTLMTYASVATPSNATENDYGISLMSTNDGGESGDSGFDFDIETGEPEEIIINLTNTFVDEGVVIKGTKTWEDKENIYNLRPEEIEISLYADGEDTGLDFIASEETGWTYEFKDQPRYDEDGSLIEYTIKETAVKGYTVSYEKITTSDTPDDEEQEDVDYSILLDRPTISFVFNDDGDREATAQALQNNARYYFVKSYTDGAGETHKVNGSISGYSVDSNTPQTVEPYEVDFSYNDKTFPKYTDTYLNTYELKTFGAVNGYDIDISGNMDDGFVITYTKQ